MRWECTYIDNWIIHKMKIHLVWVQSLWPYPTTQRRRRRRKNWSSVILYFLVGSFGILWWCKNTRIPFLFYFTASLHNNLHCKVERKKYVKMNIERRRWYAHIYFIYRYSIPIFHTHMHSAHTYVVDVFPNCISFLDASVGHESSHFSLRSHSLYSDR